jgi:hypothetical protein
MTTPEDPNSIADALDNLASDATLGSFPTGNYERGAGVLLTAARLLRESAGTTDVRHVKQMARIMAERDAAEARLAALLDALPPIESIRRARELVAQTGLVGHLLAQVEATVILADAAAAAREDQ